MIQACQWEVSLLSLEMWLNHYGDSAWVSTTVDIWWACSAASFSVCHVVWVDSLLMGTYSQWRCEWVMFPYISLSICFGICHYQRLSSSIIPSPKGFFYLMSYYPLRLCVLTHVQLFETPLTVACQAPLTMGFSRQEYWSGLSYPSAGDLPSPEVKPVSPALADRFFTAELPGKPHH